MSVISRRRRRSDPNALPRSRRVDAAGPVPESLEPLKPRRSEAATVAAELAELRDHRRRYVPVHLRGTYINSTEVRECCQPVAVAISRLKNPLVMRANVELIIDAVHGLQCVVVGMIAESRHAPADARARSRQAVADLALKPHLPGLRDEQLASGSWLGDLVGYVATYDGDLSVLLDHALPPDAYELRGNPSASDRLVRALRELDHAVLIAERRLPKVAERQAMPSMAEYNAAQQERIDAERRQRALAKLTAV